MGTCLSWAAIRGKPASVVLRALGYTTTGTREPLFWRDSTEVPFMAGHCNDWYFLFGNGNDFMSAPTLAQPLSIGSEVVVCFVESHVMVSSAAGFRDGKRIWSVVHDTQHRGAAHLEATGAPPAAWPAILRTARSKSKPGVDYLFDAPIDLAAAVTGFRHDRPTDCDFDVIARAA